MADWIKWTKGLLDKREVIRMAGLLNLPRETVVCRLMRFWEWCDDNIPKDAIRDNDSAFVDLSPTAGDNVAFIDALVWTPGFADSLSAVDWLRCRDGRIEVPNFGRHNGETAKTRARNASNQKRKRHPSREAKAPHSGSHVTEMSPEMSPPAGDKTAQRGEEKRKKKPPNPPEGGEEGEKKPRPRNLLFDALAEVAGADVSIKSVCRTIGVKAAELADAAPPYTPEEVREFGRRFHELCSYAKREGRERPTVPEIVKNIAKVRTTEAEPVVKKYKPLNDDCAPVDYDALRGTAP